MSKEMIVGAVVITALAIGWEAGPWLVGCGIKGNISMYGGEKIYHMPGPKYYWATRINPFKGERYFCSEFNARQAGWRRARV